MWGNGMAQMRQNQPMQGRQSAAAGYGTGYGVSQQPAPQQPQGAEVGNVAQIIVSGCTHATVGGIVRGSYTVSGQNHNKPTYKKDQKVNGHDVMMYYWDERDGINFSGWWFGPGIGGDQVWAYQPSRTTQTPPKSGWKVPYDGPVDTTFQITPKGAPAVVPAVVPAKVVPAKPWAQQQLQQSSPQLQQNSAQQQQQNKMQQMQQIQMQRQMLEAKKKKEEEEQKRKVEEMNKKRAEEQKKKMEEMKKKQEEQRSVLAIRQKLQKVRAATITTFEQEMKELAEVLKKELPNTGTQSALIKAEHDKGLETAKARFDQLKEAERKAEEKKAELARLQKEKEEKAAELLKELDEAVEAAEVAATALKEASEPLTAEGCDKLKPAEVSSIAGQIEEATVEVNSKVQECNAFLQKNSVAMKVQDAELKQTLSKLMHRIGLCGKDKDATIKSSALTKAKAVKQAEARAKVDKLMALFKKYDTNKDNFLDKREILNFAKREYSFVVPEAAINTILKVLVDGGAKGVKKEDFQRVKIQVGIAREQAKDNERKKLREKREKEIEEMKESMKAQIDEVDKALDEVEEAVKKVEEASKPLHLQGKDMTATEMTSFASEMEGQVKEAKEQVTGVSGQVTGLKEGVDPDIMAWMKIQMKTVELKFNRLEPRLTRVSSLCSRFRVSAKTKDKAELMQIESKAVSMMKYHKKVKSLTAEDLASAMCKGENATQASLKAFFKSCEKEKSKTDESEVVAPPSDEEIARLAKYWDEESTGKVNQEKLLSLVRSIMKVCKDTVMTNGVSIKDSESIRRLDVGEIVEVLDEPQTEGEVEVMRVKVKAMKDEAEGWVTISGNQGTVFLKPASAMYKVVKETILTSDLDLDAGDKDKTRNLVDTTRKLQLGELVEVRVWMKKEPKSGLMRMKCKAVKDGAIGWATTIGNTGTVFLEAK